MLAPLSGEIGSDWSILFDQSDVMTLLLFRGVNLLVFSIILQKYSVIQLFICLCVLEVIVRVCRGPGAHISLLHGLPFKCVGTAPDPCLPTVASCYGSELEDRPI